MKIKRPSKIAIYTPGELSTVLKNLLYLFYTTNKEHTSRIFV